MISIEIPSRSPLTLAHLVLDVNGTLAVDGALQEGVAPRIAALKQQLTVHLLTADTHGRQATIDLLLDVQAVRLQRGGEAAQKGDYVRRLGAEGNGANDADMLKAAAVSIAVLGGEGLAVETLLAADAACSNPLDALDLLLNPRRLVATLRK